MWLIHPSMVYNHFSNSHYLHKFLKYDGTKFFNTVLVYDARHHFSLIAIKPTPLKISQYLVQSVYHIKTTNYNNELDVTLPWGSNEVTVIQRPVI